jgi:adenine-specific DNA-methyltransferase
MAHAPKKTTSDKKPIEQYEHKGKKRLNNPPVGLVTPATDQEEPKKSYSYDPHLDPQLIWAGKKERTSFEVQSVSLHVHERIDPRTIIDAVKRKNGGPQMSLFQNPAENPPLREAVEFYKHKHNWSNRLIAGDSLLVMNSLLEKEGMAGQVQMVYFDPPYGITYGSNFQPFVRSKEVKDKDEDLTAEPEMVKAFRDTWELGLHSYLTYLRDRLRLAHELLSDSGSVFVQISTENLEYVSLILAEIFKPTNKVELISFRKKTMPLGGTLLEGNCDYLLWYAKDKSQVKYRKLFQSSIVEGDSHWNYVELKDGTRRQLTREEINNHSLLPPGSDVYQLIGLYPTGSFETGIYDFQLDGVTYELPPGKCWKSPIEGMRRLAAARRLQPYDAGKTLRYVLKHSDYPVSPLGNVWQDTSAPPDKRYVVQTSNVVVQRCLLMTTDPGDLVVDPTCGGATTASVAEQWGRRWITCDTSRVSVAIAKERLMAAVFEYYELAHAEEGVSSGFKYKSAAHTTLKSIANNEPPGQEVLYDDPVRDKKKIRVTGPFTVEAVPAPVVRSLEETDTSTGSRPADASVARTGATARGRDWRDELLRTGIRGRSGQSIDFTRVEPLPATRWLHADAETKEGSPQRVVVSFGPEHAPLEQRQVELAIEEAGKLVPKPKMVVFAAFQFDPEAAKDIDELNWPGVTLLKAQMNADLLTEDLKRKRASNESFWLIGQPDLEAHRVKDGEDRGKYSITVNGFDYYDTKNGKIESGGTEKIAMWMLDPDYDGRSLFPRQVFFPMAGDDEGWAKLAKTLRAEVDPELIEAYRGTTSLPFAAGKNKRVAVKIIDDRGIESLRIVDLE